MIQDKKHKKIFLLLCTSVLLLIMVSCEGYKDKDLINEPFSIEYRLSGGIAGFNDKATIKSTGEFTYMVGDKVISEGILEKTDIDKLRSLAILDNNFKDKESSSDDTKDYPDKLTTDFTVNFKNKVGTSKKSTEIIELINSYKERFKK